MTEKYGSSLILLHDEFRTRPFGRHSPALQALLNFLRQRESGLNLLLVMERPDRWLLAERVAPDEVPRLIPGKIYRSREEAELAVFDVRLARLCENTVP